jgi:MFS family permease
MGVYQSAGSLARIVGPPVAGFLYDVQGIGVPFVAAATLSLLAGVVAATWQARGFVREATLTFRQGGIKGTLQRYGWKLFAFFFLYYLVRDVTLYIVLPYFAARGVLSLWR